MAHFHAHERFTRADLDVAPPVRLLGPDLHVVVLLALPAQPLHERVPRDQLAFCLGQPCLLPLLMAMGHEGKQSRWLLLLLQALHGLFVDLSSPRLGPALYLHPNGQTFDPSQPHRPCCLS